MRPALLAVITALMFTAPAPAEYYLSKGLAQRYAGHYARTHHGLHSVSARCRPKGHPNADTTQYVFHRWICAYGGYDDYSSWCSGLIQVKGGDAHGVYWTIVYQGLRCQG